MSQPTETTAQHAKREAIIAAAVSQLGVTELPVGSNWGPKVEQFLAAVGIAAPAAWCAAFACWCLRQAGAVPGLVKPSGYCPTLADNARASGTLMASADVAAGRAEVHGGDLLLVWETFGDGELNDYHHSGLVETPPDANGDFTSIEGNTNTNGSSEGYEVARQHRNIHTLAADGHARYAFAQTV